MTSGTDVPQTFRKSKTKKGNSFHADGRDGEIPSPALPDSTKATSPFHGGANGILREDFPLHAEGKPGIFR